MRVWLFALLLGCASACTESIHTHHESILNVQSTTPITVRYVLGDDLDSTQGLHIKVLTPLKTPVWLVNTTLCIGCSPIVARSGSSQLSSARVNTPVGYLALAGGVWTLGRQGPRVTAALALGLALHVSSADTCDVEVTITFPRSGLQGYDTLALNLPSDATVVQCPPAFSLENGGCQPKMPLPPIDKVKAQSMFRWVPKRANECPSYIHDMFWVKAEDDKIYPRWHLPEVTIDGFKCAFGHEHGDDPNSPGPYQNELFPFGFVNEKMYEHDPTNDRHENHEGHKFHVTNADICANNVVTDCEGGKKIATCHSVLKVHQGTSSGDAFVNNLHEVLLYAKCDQHLGYYFKGGGVRVFPSNRMRGPMGPMMSNFVGYKRLAYLDTLISWAGAVAPLDSRRHLRSSTCTARRDRSAPAKSKWRTCRGTHRTVLIISGLAQWLMTSAWLTFNTLMITVISLPNIGSLTKSS